MGVIYPANIHNPLLFWLLTRIKRKIQFPVKGKSLIFNTKQIQIKEFFFRILSPISIQILCILTKRVEKI